MHDTVLDLHGLTQINLMLLYDVLGELSCVFLLGHFLIVDLDM